MTKHIIAFLIAIFMLSCEQPVKVVYQYIEPIAEPIEEVIEMEIKSIDWYNNYVVSNQYVFGIDGSKLESVIPETKQGDKLSFDDFFKKDGRVYFTIKAFEKGKEIPGTDPIQYESVEKIYYFEQYMDELKEITKAQFPDKPKSDRISFTHAPYKIEKDVYEDKDISRVYRGTLVEAYLSIDGCCKTDGGLWFSVSETFSTRYEGVYYWPLDKPKIRFKDSGRIW